MAQFHQLEEYHGPKSYRCESGWVCCSFKSDHRREGTMVVCSDGHIKTLNNQPDLQLYPKHEQRYMKKATTIAYRLCTGNDHKA